MRSVFLSLLVCASASAATLQQLSMDQMTQAATAIVRATITGSSASFTGSTIYTHYKLSVAESWKGSAVAEVAAPGGVANGYRQNFPGIPQLQIGAQYVLFLWTSPSTGITHLVGFSQGVYCVTTQSDGSVQAARNAIGETMLDAAGHVVRDQAVQMSLPGMKSRVLAALAPAGINQ